MRSIKFHQNFKFDRGRLATCARCMLEQGSVSKKQAAAYMGVGEAAAEGFIGWMLKTGMGAPHAQLSGNPKAKGYGLTPLGRLIASHDPEFAAQGTLWLLHYALVTEHNERAEIWYRAFNELVTPGIPLTQAMLQTYVERSLSSAPTNTSGIVDDCKTFFSSYTQPVGLSKLELIREVGAQQYEVGLQRQPDHTLFAFALFDAWERRYAHTDTLRVTQICEEAELPGKVFAAQRSQIVELLQILQSHGMVSMVDSQHEPVTRRYRGTPLALLERYYASL